MAAAVPHPLSKAFPGWQSSHGYETMAAAVPHPLSTHGKIEVSSESPTKTPPRKKLQNILMAAANTELSVKNGKGYYKE
nr:hypothetical protein [Desulfobacterales bacterium]